MKERPIFCNTHMVRAILDGGKTQTRRPVKISDWWEGHFAYSALEDQLCSRTADKYLRCPFGVPGDRLYVRETTVIAPKKWGDPRFCNATDNDGAPRLVQYLATSPDLDGASQYGLKATPSIHMPKWAARIWLEITEIRVERLQNITEADAEGEGMCGHQPEDKMTWKTPREQFIDIWDVIYGEKYPWKSNQWVWVIEFKQVGSGDADQNGKE